MKVREILVELSEREADPTSEAFRGKDFAERGETPGTSTSLS